jgi:hypothetical protein
VLDWTAQSTRFFNVDMWKAHQRRRQQPPTAAGPP